MTEIILADRLDQLLTPPREVEAPLPDLLQKIYDRKYTGRITLHFHNGTPTVVEFLAPKIKLT